MQFSHKMLKITKTSLPMFVYVSFKARKAVQFIS